eukprot:204591-Chlamydomonas_euryale.AAC.3
MRARVRACVLWGGGGRAQDAHEARHRSFGSKGAPRVCVCATCRVEEWPSRLWDLGCHRHPEASMARACVACCRAQRLAPWHANHTAG